MPSCEIAQHLTILSLLLSSARCLDIIIRASYYRKETITTNINPDLVIATFTESKYLHCGYRCSRIPATASLYFDEGTATCYCNNKTDETRQPSSDANSVIYAYITRTELHAVSDPCIGCGELKDTGYRRSGFYEIQMPSSSDHKELYCDLAGEWTVFQKRFDGSVDFYRPWADYVNGFGSPPEGEFWLGLAAIHNLTAAGACELMIYLEAECNHPVQSVGYARYSSFSVSSAAMNYKLSVSGFSGDVGDALAYHNNRMFSTYDVDNDAYWQNCAAGTKGAWWYGGCIQSNLNGLYRSGTSPYADCMDWKFPWGLFYSLLKTEMKIKCT